MAIGMRKYLEQLETAGFLVRVTKQVDPVHELPAVANKIHKKLKKAVCLKM